MYLTLLLALLMIVGWGYTGITWLIYLMIVLLSLGIVFDKHEKKIVYLFFILPWTYVVGLRFYAILSLVYFFTIIINGFIKEKRKISIKVWISILLFLSITLLSLLFEQSNLSMAILLYACMAVLIGVMINGVPYIDVTEAIRVFTFSLIISCVIGLMLDNFTYFYNIIRAYDIDIASEYFLRFTGLDGDPNFLSFYIMISIAGIGILLFYETQKRVKLLYYSILILLSLFGFLTFSNSFIIIWSLYFASYILLVNKGKKRMQYIICIMMFFIVIYTMFTPFTSILSKGYSYRAMNFTQRYDINPIIALTSGRSDMWKTYLISWSESTINILFGKGNMAREFYTSHNTFIRILYMFGLFGLLSFIFMIIAYSRQIYYKKKVSKNYVNYIPIVVFILYTLVLDMFRGNAIPYLFPFIILLINYMVYTKNSLQKG